MYDFKKEPLLMSQKQINVLRAVLFAVAVVFILVGLLRSEARSVFMKAIFICLECIGIG